jgi:hypothetical protein
VNTTIVLEKADPNWGLRPTRIIKSSADKASTTDGGKTWIFKEIKIKESIAPDEYVRNQ